MGLAGRRPYRGVKRGAFCVPALTRAGLFLALFALFSQAIVLAVPPMAPPGNVREAARELVALVGPDVFICAQADESRAPAAPAGCDDRCPICQAGAGGLAFVAPSPAFHLSPSFVLGGPLAFPKTPRAPPRGPNLIALARGPPASI